MVVKKQPDSSSKTGSIEADGLDWFQQFVKHLEINWSTVFQRIASNNDQSAYHLEVLRAVKLTLKDSGMDESSIQTAFAQVAFEGPMQEDGTGWTIEQNKRRFELIDRDIRGTITAIQAIDPSVVTGRAATRAITLFDLGFEMSSCFAASIVSSGNRGGR